MALGVCELLWLQKILEELRLSEKGKLSLYCDNKTAISIAHNLVYHDRTKHVEISRHFIKEKITTGVLSLFHVPSEKQLAAMFAKVLNKRTFHTLVSKLGVCYIFTPT